MPGNGISGNTDPLLIIIMPPTGTGNLSGNIRTPVQPTTRLDGLNDLQRASLEKATWRKLFSDDSFPNIRAIDNLGARGSDPLADYMAIKQILESYDFIGCKDNATNLKLRVMASHYLELLLDRLQDPDTGREYTQRVLPIIKEYCLHALWDTLHSPRHVDELTNEPLCLANRLELMNAPELWFCHYFCTSELGLLDRQKTELKNSLLVELQVTSIERNPDFDCLRRTLRQQEYVSLRALKALQPENYGRLMKTVGTHGRNEQEKENSKKIYDSHLQRQKEEKSRTYPDVGMTSSDIRLSLTGSHHLSGRINNSVTRDDNFDLHIGGRTYMVIDDYANQYLGDRKKQTEENTVRQEGVETQDITMPDLNQVPQPEPGTTTDVDLPMRENKKEPEESKEG